MRVSLLGVVLVPRSGLSGCAPLCVCIRPNMKGVHGPQHVRAAVWDACVGFKLRVHLGGGGMVANVCNLRRVG